MKKVKEEMKNEPLQILIMCEFSMPVPDININISFGVFKRFFKA